MQHPDEGTIQTWLDGELPPEEAAALEAHVAVCQECTASVAEARGYIAASSRIVTALDAVPGNVIPAARPKRSWYANTQLRAAAAIIIVAGASLLAVKQTGKTLVGNVVATSRSEARVPKASSPPMTAQPNNTLPMAAAAKVSEQKVSGGSAPSQKAAGKVTTPPLPATTASPAIPAAPVPAAQNSVMDEAPNETRAEDAGARLKFGRRSTADSSVSRPSSPILSDVVVTGVAERVEELSVVRVDTVVGEVRTMYRIPTGEEVVLTESSNIAARAGTATTMSALAAPKVMQKQARQQTPVHNSITWVEKVTGRIATLSGPLTKEALEALRQKLPPEHR